MTFIINLAICDLMYCSIHLPIYAKQYLGQGPFLSETLCIGFAILRNINVRATYIFMGMMATSRCLSLAKITILEKCRKVIAVYIWIFIILIYLPQISYARYVSKVVLILKESNLFQKNETLNFCSKKMLNLVMIVKLEGVI